MTRYKAATRDELLRKLANRYTSEKNKIAKLHLRIKRLEKVKAAAYEYLQARSDTNDTARAAQKREASFARLRFALLQCKRAEAQNR